MGRQNQNLYVTTQGDTWDSIALRLLGSELLMWMFVDANPDYRGVMEFPANVELVVPNVEKAEGVSFPSWWA